MIIPPSALQTHDAQISQNPSDSVVIECTKLYINKGLILCIKSPKYYPFIEKLAEKSIPK